MELDFDKEIDALLRRKDFSPANSSAAEVEHLGADEIAAFADNAVPDSSRGIYMRHLSACDRCRRVLSNVIALNAERAPSLEQSAAPAIVTAAAEPWYRGLLRFPGFVYAMGALTVLFAGFLAFSIMQNRGTDRLADLSQVSEARKPSAGVSSEVEALPEQQNSANTASNSNATVAREPVGSNMANLAASGTVTGVGNAPPAGTATAPVVNGAASTTNEFRIDGRSAAPAAPAAPPSAAASTADSIATSEAKKDSKEAELSDLPLSARKVQNLPLVRQENDALLKMRPERNAQDKSKVLSGPSRDMNSQIQNSQAQTMQSQDYGNNSLEALRTRTIASRTFELKQGVWYDSSFSGQVTVNVRRGTETYRQLDAGLRSAVDRLGGTVVIVWKSKAYRIQ